MSYFAEESNVYKQCIEDASRTIRPYLRPSPKLIIQSGSGFGFLTDLNLPCTVSLPYKLIPHFPVPSVSGHGGVLHIFTNEDAQVVVLEGRFHGYEGLDPWQLAFPIRVLSEFTPERMLLTSAVGGIHPASVPGDLVAIQNYINFQASNPLRGLDESIFGSRFVPMDKPFEQHLYGLFKEAIRSEGLPCQLHNGVYLGVTGPCYESEAEITAFGDLKADVVGMSVVCETITAKACKIPLSVLCLITNYACGRFSEPLNHDEVVQMTHRMSPIILKIMNFVLGKL